MRIVSAAEVLADDQPIERIGHPVLGEHLSFSAVKTFLRCPEQWRQAYILGKRQPPNLNLIHGKADHYATATNLTHKINTGTLLALADVKDLFSDNYNEQTTAAKDTYGVILGTDKNTIGAVKDTGIRMVEAYTRFVTPTIRPIAVEREVHIPIADCPVPLLGYIDIEEDTKIIERKTAANSKLDFGYRSQAMLYALATQKPCNIHVITKTKEPKIITEWTYAPTPTNNTTAERFLANIAHSIMATYETFGPDQPWPGAITDRDACGWCGFRPDCPWWRI